MSDFADRIAKYRGKHDLSHGDLAKLCNVSRLTIALIENGKTNPTRLTREKIERVINEKEGE